MSSNIQSKGFAAKDEQGGLALWNFERRAVGNDIKGSCWHLIGFNLNLTL